MRKERVLEVGMFEVLEAVFSNYHWYKEQERNLPPKHRRIHDKSKNKVRDQQVKVLNFSYCTSDSNSEPADDDG